jgi:glycogen synthase
VRVLMLSWEYTPHVVGGLGKHVVELVPALAAEGIEVHIMTPRWRGGAVREAISGEGNIVVHRADIPADVERFDFYTNAHRANQLLREASEQVIAQEGPFDLVHVHDWLVGFAATEIKHAHKLPLAVTIHATEWGRGRQQLGSAMAHAIHNVEWWLTYEAWRVVATSGYMANEIMNIFQVPHDKLAVIPNGIDTKPFDNLEGTDLSDVRSRYALPSERIIFSVGRIVDEKGFQVLADAAPYVLNAVPEAKFIVAGTGPSAESLRARIRENALGGKFYYAGFVADGDRDGLLRLSDVAVFPSLYEPFGIVALEAMAAKAPVVVSNVGGLAEVVHHGETGILVYPNDPRSLAWGIIHTLQHPYWAHNRAEQAYQVVVEKYNWQVIAKATVEMYEKVVEERKGVDW